MYYDIESLKGTKVHYNGCPGKIVKAYGKADKPYLCIEYSVKGSKEKAREEILLDANTVEFLNSPKKPLDEEKSRLVVALAKEFVKNRLETAYNNTYELILNNGDSSKIRPAFSSDESDRANLQYALEYACSGMPEAIFELCDNHRQFAKILETVYTPEQLALFGHRSGDRIGCSFTKIYATTRPELRRRMIEEREIIICGTEDGYYGEDGTTWRNIAENILPISTRDIWDTLYVFFNGPDALVDPEDRQKFNERYDAEYVPKYSKKNAIIAEEKRETSKSLSEIVSAVLELLYQMRYDEVAKKLSAGTERQKSIISYAVAVKELPPEEKPPEWEKLLKRCEKNLINLPENRVYNLMNELTFVDQMGLIDFLRRIAYNGIPVPWANIMKDYYEKSLSADNVQWWIATLDAFNILIEYSRNTDFWDGIKPSGLMPLIDKFKSSLTPERFLAFAESICATYKKLGRSASEVCRCWKKHILQALLDLPFSDTNARVFSSTLLNVFSEEMPQLLESLFVLLSNTKTAEPEKKAAPEQIADGAEKLSTQMRGFSELEKTLNSRRMFNSDSYAFITDVLRQLLRIKEDLAYLADHEWHQKISPVVRDVAFLDFADIPYDPAKHLSAEDLEEGTAVKALSSGLELDGKVRYKAVVSASKGGRL